MIEYHKLKNGDAGVRSSGELKRGQEITVDGRVGSVICKLWDPVGNEDCYGYKIVWKKDKPAKQLDLPKSEYKGTTTTVCPHCGAPIKLIRT